MAFYNLDNKLDQKRFKKRCNLLYEKGKPVELKEHRPKRTNPQNRYLHAILSLYAIETGYTLEETKQDIFKREINKDIFLKEKNGREVSRSTADLDTKEITLAIEKFRDHSSKDVGIYLPDPDETEYLNAIEEEINRNKRFL